MSIPGFIEEGPAWQRPGLPGGAASAPSVFTGRDPADAAIVPQAGLPIYGNHCGPGYGDPNRPAIDPVDALCKTHDGCYASRGYFDCRCDRALIWNMPGAIAGTATAAGKAAGVAVMTYFANAACVCRNRVCVRVPFVGTRCTTVTLPGRGGIGPC